MFFRIAAASIVSMVLGFSFFLSPVQAQSSQKNAGLTVAPVRQEIDITAGKTTRGTINIANYTDEEMTVDLSVQQFTAADYTYEYEFRPLKEDWIVFESPRMVLRPAEERAVTFTIDAPTAAVPGGHYFALLASADMSSNNLQRTAQVVSQLYVRVSGALLRTGSISNESVPFFVFDTKVPYTFDARNTGNVHYTAQFFGQLKGPFLDQPQTSASHLLLPGTIRQIGGSVPAPLLPGLYQLDYGYRTDASEREVAKSAYIMYIPPWSIALMVIALLGGRWIWRYRRTRRNKH